MKLNHTFVAIVALIAWRCAAQSPSTGVRQKADGGNVTSHSEGLHGYIGFEREPPPTDGGYSAGMGFLPPTVWTF